MVEWIDLGVVVIVECYVFVLFMELLCVLILVLIDLDFVVMVCDNVYEEFGVMGYLYWLILDFVWIGIDDVFDIVYDELECCIVEFVFCFVVS